MTSRRASWNLSENPLWAAVEKRRAEGKELIDLIESNPTRVGLPYPAKEIREALSNPGVLAYEPTPRGLPAARQAIAKHYASRGETVDPDRILLTAGTSDAYSFLWKLLADPGDEILVPRPSYPLFDFLATLDSVVPREYTLSPQGIDMASIERALGPRTRAIVLVHPNNPTGAFVQQRDLDALAELAKRYHLAIISDEVFADYPLSNGPRAGTVALRQDVPCFSLSGLSKLALLPQVKLGWIVVGGPPDDTFARLEMISDTYLSVSAPAQHAAARLLEIMRPVREALIRRIQQNARAIQAPEAGWYAVLPVPGDASDVDRAVRMVETHGVHVHPGSFYGLPGHFVVSLIVEPDRFRLGLNAIRESLRG